MAVKSRPPKHPKPSQQGGQCGVWAPLSLRYLLLGLGIAQVL